MSQQVQIVLDSDVIIHFIKGIITSESKTI